MFQRIRSSGSLSAEAVSNIKEYGRPMAALFSLRPHSFLLRKKRIAAASEEASSIPFPPGRRKLHIRSLLPSQIVTVSLGHNLAIWNFTTPHAILMMADRRHFADTVCRGRKPEKGRTLSRPALCIIFSSFPSRSAGAATKTHRRGCQADPSGRTRPSPARRRPCRRRL